MAEGHAAALAARRSGRPDPALEVWATRFAREGRKYGFPPAIPGGGVLAA